MIFLIWQRYFLKEILKIFGLFLFAFYLLYALVDYSTHMQDFIKNNQIQIGELFLYYSFQFLKRATLLIPLAILVATIKVLSTFNAHRELVALQTSGIPFKKLMGPFFLVAGICTLFNYCSAEFLLPNSLNFIDKFNASHFKHSYKEKGKEPLRVIHLKNQSKLIYQSYDAETESFFDAIWIASSDHLWRIKYLKDDPEHAMGQYVDHLARNSKGFFEKVESFPNYEFTEIKWDRNMPPKGFIPIENRALSELYALLAQKKTTTSYARKEILAQMTYKGLIPLSSLFVVIAVGPFCIGYSRKLPIFFIYAAALFGFISFFTLMDGAVILGENQVFSPFWAVFIPFVLCVAPFAWKFVKTH